MKMKGKTKKRKFGKVLLLGLSFILTIVLTFSMTMAWFFDSDWASKDITMAGKVGIELRDYNEVVTSGQGALNFKISTEKAYPGQAVQVSAEVRNNSTDDLTSAGSACYIRARFTVFTDIMDPAFDATRLYKYIASLIAVQNNDPANTTYCWNYYTSNAMPLSESGVSTTDVSYYLNGNTYSKDPDNSSDTNYYLDGDPTNDAYTEVQVAALQDEGYYYLCYKAGIELSENIPTESDDDDKTVTEPSPYTTTANILKPLAIDESNVFLMDSTFLIPWTLTNSFADKTLRVLVTFQAVQTFIPQIIEDNDVSTGKISTAANNQLLPSLCVYDNISVKTVFNSCAFEPIRFSCHHCGATAEDSGFTEYSESTAVCQNEECGKTFGLTRCAVKPSGNFFENPYQPAS